MNPYSNVELLTRYGFRTEQVQDIGVPIIIHREDLRAVLPHWWDYMEAIRGDTVSRELLGGHAWIAEMCGYVMACAKIGLWHEIQPLAQFQNENRDDLPLVHYCYVNTRIKWAKFV